MYSKILVPLDGSKRAEAILPYVESLAKSYGAHVILLRVIEPHSRYVNPMSAQVVIEQDIFRQETEEVETYLINQQDKLHQKGISSRVFVAYGPVVEEIIKAAEAEKADLIAIASHGRTGLSRVFYGSVVAGVLHRIDRPLLIIRSLDHS